MYMKNRKIGAFFNAHPVYADVNCQWKFASSGKIDFQLINLYTELVKICLPRNEDCTISFWKEPVNFSSIAISAVVFRNIQT